MALRSSIPWQYGLPPEPQQQQAPRKGKKSGGGFGGLLNLVSGIIGGMDFGEPPVGDFAPNIDGMEGIGFEPNVPAFPSETPAPQAGALVPPTPAPAVPPTTAPLVPVGHPYMAPPSPLQQTAATYQPGKGQMVPVPPMAVAYGPPAPGDPFAAIQNDPRYVNRIQGGPRPLDINNVREVHLHDRGGRTPNTNNYRALPYHVEVQPNGQIVQTRASNQMGAGSYKSNPRSLHVTYGGKVGALPTRQAMSSLQKVYETLKMHNPSWQFPSHGQAFNATRGGPFQASVDGRGLAEARWRGFLR